MFNGLIKKNRCSQAKYYTSITICYQPTFNTFLYIPKKNHVYQGLKETLFKTKNHKTYFLYIAIYFTFQYL